MTSKFLDDITLVLVWDSHVAVSSTKISNVCRMAQLAFRSPILTRVTAIQNRDLQGAPCILDKELKQELDRRIDSGDRETKKFFFGI